MGWGAVVVVVAPPFCCYGKDIVSMFPAASDMASTVVALGALPNRVKLQSQKYPIDLGTRDRHYRRSAYRSSQSSSSPSVFMLLRGERFRFPF
jgi:hypothetical protein